MSEKTYWTKYWNQRASRRRFLGTATAAGVGAGAFALVGCGGDDDDDGNGNGNGNGNGGNGGDGTPGATREPGEPQEFGSTTEELREQFHWSRLQNVAGQDQGPKPGGKFTFAGFDPGTWNLTDPGAAIMSSFAGHHYNGLVTFPISDFDDAHKLAPEGDLAESWEQPDDTTIIFHLHEGVTWQDVEPTHGRALTAEDVAYGYTVLRDQTSFQAGTYEQVREFATPDENTVVFNLNEPAAYLLNNMMVPVHVVAPRELVENPDLFADTAVGTGPFILESWEPGGTWRARKNPNYFRQWNGNQLPFIDELESRNFSGNAAGALAAFRSGELDTYNAPDVPTMRTLLEEQPDLVGQIATPPPGAQNYISMHIEREPWNNPMLRQALSLAIDRETINEGIFNGLSGPGYSQDWSFFQDETGGYREWPWDAEELGDFHHHDPEEAVRLYEAAGYSRDNPLTMQYNYSAVPGPGQDLHLLILEMWRETLGVEAEFVGMETIGWVGAHFSREYQDALGSWYSGPAFDPDGYSYEVLHSNAPGNIYGVSDPDLDDLLVRQRRELDVSARQQLLRDAMLIDLNNCYRIWTRNAYKKALRKPNYFNVVDTIHAWGNIGWGAKGDEKVWVL